MFVVCDVESLIMPILSAKKSQEAREGDATIFGRVTHGHKPRIHAILCCVYPLSCNSVLFLMRLLQRKVFQRHPSIFDRPVAYSRINGPLRQKKTKAPFFNFRPGLEPERYK